MNKVSRFNVSAMPAPSGGWVWDGSNWVCDPDCGTGAPCPPFGPPVFSGPAGQPPWYPGANGGVSFGQTFPPNPVRGHLFWDGVTFWLFDGAAWVAVGGSSSAVHGVTDGSNAPQGTVGEYLCATNQTAATPVPIPVVVATAPPYTFTTVAVLNLGAGDWGIQGAVSLETGPSTGAHKIQFSVSPSDVTDPNNDFLYWPAGWTQLDWGPAPAFIDLFVGHIRVNRSSGFTILLRGAITGPGPVTGSAGAWYYLDARRVR